MMTNDSKRDLIEEAAATIAVAELVASQKTWGDLVEPQKDEYRDLASAVFAVFEKAHAPTDDEIRIATLAAVKKGAKSDAEAVRNYREAERVIRAALPHLASSVVAEAEWEYGIHSEIGGDAILASPVIRRIQAEGAAKALREAAEAYEAQPERDRTYFPKIHGDWLRNRADRIEQNSEGNVT